MALTKADLAAIAALVDERLAAAPKGAPVTVAAASPTVARGTHIGPSGKPDGRDFLCTVAGAECGRWLRSAERAAIHGVAKGGHTPADAD